MGSRRGRGGATIVFKESRHGRHPIQGHEVPPACSDRHGRCADAVWAGCTRPATRRRPQPRLPRAPLRRALEDFGVELVALRLSGADFLIDLRYRVKDVGQGADAARAEDQPVLVNEATGDRFYVPQAPKVGSLAPVGDGEAAGASPDGSISCCLPIRTATQGRGKGDAVCRRFGGQGPRGGLGGSRPAAAALARPPAAATHRAGPGRAHRARPGRAALPGDRPAGAAARCRRDGASAWPACRRAQRGGRLLETLKAFTRRCRQPLVLRICRRAMPRQVVPLVTLNAVAAHLPAKDMRELAKRTDIASIRYDIGLLAPSRRPVADPCRPARPTPRQRLPKSCRDEGRAPGRGAGGRGFDAQLRGPRPCRRSARRPPGRPATPARA